MSDIVSINVNTQSNTVQDERISNIERELNGNIKKNLVPYSGTSKNLWTLGSSFSPEIGNSSNITLTTITDEISPFKDFNNHYLWKIKIGNSFKWNGFYFAQSPSRVSGDYFPDPLPKKVCYSIWLRDEDVSDLTTGDGRIRLFICSIDTGAEQFILEQYKVYQINGWSQYLIYEDFYMSPSRINSDRYFGVGINFQKLDSSVIGKELYICNY